MNNTAHEVKAVNSLHCHTVQAKIPDSNKGKGLRSVSTTRVRGPSWRPANSGAFFDTRQLGPSTRVVETGRPCTRAEFSGRQLGLWTRVVETDL